MSRYYAAGWIEDDVWTYQEDSSSRSIDVPDHIARDTGLFTAQGDRIMKSPRPIGYGRDMEW